MREISPFENLCVNEFVAGLNPDERRIVEQIRFMKASGQRPLPSTNLIDNSAICNASWRSQILNKIAELVDENLFGRSEMCQQFADLLSKALNFSGISARPVAGTAIYFDGSGREPFRWNHAWVAVNDEVVDGNVDILNENPTVPKSITLCPFWGPIKQIPRDRRLRSLNLSNFPTDSDVEKIWWPELEEWLASVR